MYVFEREQVNQYKTGRAICQFEGIMDRTMRFVEEFQLTDVVLWKRFVEQFRLQTDIDDAGWRGEYWGKMMRGACFVYSYTKNEELYAILAETIRDMMERCDEYGRISTYDVEHEFIGWDIWSRKYVMLGMQYFLEICQDEKLADDIIACMCGQADYIMSKIGPEEGKKPITDATNHWRGLNSVSILEPIVRLYNLTQEEKYLTFAEYIVSTGGTSIENIFELALANQFYPYQYPVTKAYEMTSCFEGLLEFYRVKKIEWHKTAIINYANRILESDFTVIGSSGCTHELFDHSTVRQANTTNEIIMQETCVTVTLMKFFYQLTLLTGKSDYVDAFERALYNAYLGAVNTEKSIEPTIRDIYPDAVIEPLPFDSYSPLTPGTRGNGIGGLKLMPDSHYYGCCACIGAAGIGIVPKMTLMKCDNGVAVNLYIPGTIQTTAPSGEKVILTVNTKYPQDGHIRIQVDTNAKEAFSIRLRNPAWSRETEVRVNGEVLALQEGYIEFIRCWKTGDEIELILDMRTEAVYPIPYGHEILMNKVIWGHNYMVSTYDVEDPKAKYHLALRRGPLALAVDSRLGYDAGGTFDIAVSEDGYVKVQVPEEETAPYEHMIELEVPMEDGTSFRVTDYASAGKLWTEESKMAAWIYTGRSRGRRIMMTICGDTNYLPGWIGQKEDGMFVRKAIFKTNKSDTQPIRILNFADVHLNYINEEDLSNEEVMYSKECRTWNADGASVKALEKAMKYGEEFDKIVITGDVMDYLTCGAMELMDKYIWEKDPNVMVALGGHELTRQMQTGRPDMTTLEERQAVVEKFWRHDMYYLSEVLGDKVMIIQLDNSCHKYWDFQIEKLARDIEIAREKGYIILIFQHEGISTGKPEDAENVFAIRESDGAGNHINFYNRHVVGHIGESNKATREVYKLLTENADVIKGFFCGHYHSAYYTEVKGSYLDENGQKQEVMIPQYAVEGLVYDDYVGHVMEITVV